MKVRILSKWSEALCRECKEDHGREVLARVAVSIGGVDVELCRSHAARLSYRLKDSRGRWRTYSKVAR